MRYKVFGLFTLLALAAMTFTPAQAVTDGKLDGNGLALPVVVHRREAMGSSNRS